MSLDAVVSAGPEVVSGPAIRPQSDATTWIYFINVEKWDRIKVGHSRQPYGKRLNQHSNHLGQKLDLELLCEVRGHVSDEKAIKRYFRKWRWSEESDEVFKPCIELVEYIRWLRDQWWVAVPGVIDNAERDALPARASSEWLPDETRRKPAKQDLFAFDIFQMGLPRITQDDFYTNKVIIDAARQCMGRIDLDPASHIQANRVVGATKFYTIDDNGLEHEWAGMVWLNPPFSAWEYWVPKILREWASGRVEEMCVLSAMRTVTAQYFQPFLAATNAVCVTNGRIPFWGGKAGPSPDDGHAIFYFGNRRREFAQAFDGIGTVFYRGDA